MANVEQLDLWINAIYVVVVTQGAVVTAVMALWAWRLAHGRSWNGLLTLVAGVAILAATITVENSAYGSVRLLGIDAFARLAFTPAFIVGIKLSYILGMALTLASLGFYLSGSRKMRAIMRCQAAATALLYAAAYAVIAWWRR